MPRTLAAAVRLFISRTSRSRGEAHFHSGRVSAVDADALTFSATVRGVRGCHTQGRTVDDARRRIVEAMELFVDNARTATIMDDLKLPRGAARAVRTYATLRRKAEEEDRRAALAARRAVRMLRGGRLKMSAREAARLLGLSHQRVLQLRQDEAH